MPNGLRKKLESQELQDRAFDDLKAKLDGFDLNKQDVRTYYKFSVIPWLAGMLDGEVELIAPLVKDKLGLNRDSLFRDVRTYRKQNAQKAESKKAAKEENSLAADFAEVIPLESPIAGATVLGEISDFLSRYAVLPKGASDAIAAWVVATWMRDELYFAPILALLSPTKRSGKTLLLDLLRPIVFRGFLTSGVGITPAVLFRMNEKFRPTILIDEAEKLSGDDSAKELIGLLNKGYRKGAKVPRCAGDSHDIQVFDAFGFRVVAANGRLWDTLTDRSITIPMSRKPPGTTVQRFSGRVVEEEGGILARKIARWTQDYKDVISTFEPTSPRPPWLNDRACDNWGPLLAIGTVVEGGWVNRLLSAAQVLQSEEDDGDRGELLLKDIRGLFVEAKNPDYIESATLKDHLNDLQESPWADLSGGKGLTPHKLSAILRRFGIRPRQQRTSDGIKIRGYWLEDFNEAFSRYLPAIQGSELGQSGQGNKNNRLEDSQIGTETPPVQANRDKNNSINSSSYEVCPACPDSKGGEQEKVWDDPWVEVEPDDSDRFKSLSSEDRKRPDPPF